MQIQITFSSLCLSDRPRNVMPSLVMSIKGTKLPFTTTFTTTITAFNVKTDQCLKDHWQWQWFDAVLLKDRCPAVTSEIPFLRGLLLGPRGSIATTNHSDVNNIHKRALNAILL